MAADAPGGAKALIDGLAGLIGLGVFGLVAAAGFGAFSEGDPAPLPVQLAESELALAYARAAPGYRCRSAEQGGAWYVLCAASGPSGGALFAVLAAAPVQDDEDALEAILAQLAQRPVARIEAMRIHPAAA